MAAGFVSAVFQFSHMARKVCFSVISKLALDSLQGQTLPLHLYRSFSFGIFLFPLLRSFFVDVTSTPVCRYPAKRVIRAPPSRELGTSAACHQRLPLHLHWSPLGGSSGLKSPAGPTAHLRLQEPGTAPQH